MLCTATWYSVPNHVSLVMSEITAKKEVLSLSLLFGCLAVIIPSIDCEKKRYS